MNEKELVLMAKDGNVKAFCVLYDRYKRSFTIMHTTSWEMQRMRRMLFRIV